MLLGAGGGLYANYRHSFGRVSLSLPSNIPVSIYHDRGGDGPANYDPDSSSVAKFSGTQSLTLKLGTYDAVIDDPKHEYKDGVTKFEVNSANSTIALNASYSDSKLSALLPGVRASAQDAIKKALAPGGKGYVMAEDEVFGVGEWYAVVLRPTSPSQDVLKVLAHKDGDTWKIVAGPSISIGQPSHPNIPQAVLTSTDKLGLPPNQ